MRLVAVGRSGRPELSSGGWTDTRSLGKPSTLITRPKIENSPGVIADGVVAHELAEENKPLELD